MTVGTMYRREVYDSRHYVKERSVKGMTVGALYRRGVWRVWQWALCTEEEYKGYGKKHYVQERSTKDTFIPKKHV